MKVIKNIKMLETALEAVRTSGKKTGFVPTMGALHAGHIALVERSVKENDYTIVSIFVNPTQFNNKQDLQKYPRDFEKDAEMLQLAGVDLIFAPEIDDMYQDEELNHTFEYDFAGLDKVMEGAFRPGHFNGVVQVVSKLFTYVKPNRAYFGEKDFQQLAIIHHMNKMLHFNVEIVDCPIVREPSGLAMSSRNERLTSEQRNIAAGISKVLFESLNFVPAFTPNKLKNWVEAEIGKIDGLRLEYYEIANASTLQTAQSWDKPTVGCIAVFCGDVRLIDNIRCS